MFDNRGMAVSLSDVTRNEIEAMLKGRANMVTTFVEIEKAVASYRRSKFEPEALPVERRTALDGAFTLCMSLKQRLNDPLLQKILEGKTKVNLRKLDRDLGVVGSAALFSKWQANQKIHRGARPRVRALREFVSDIASATGLKLTGTSKDPLRSAKGALHSMVTLILMNELNERHKPATIGYAIRTARETQSAKK